MVDQIQYHDLNLDLPRDHLVLRRAVVRAILHDPRYFYWMDNVVGREEEKEDETEKERRERRARAELKMAQFLQNHSKDGCYTDDDGIMCQVGPDLT